MSQVLDDILINILACTAPYMYMHHQLRQVANSLAMVSLSGRHADRCIVRALKLGTTHSNPTTVNFLLI